MNKLIYIGFSFLHHKGNNAGYHHIADYLHYDKKMDCQREFEWPILQQNYIGRTFVRILGRLHYPYNMWVVVRCLFYNLFHSHCVYHFIYGENTYRWLHYFLRKSSRIVCTFHQPFSWFENPEWRKKLRQLDGIILMSDDELDKFKAAAPQAKVCFIPHGINTDFYREGKEKRKKQILMVGNWLRKFDFANEVFQRLLDEDKDLKVVVVTNLTNQIHFQSHPRLTFLSGISDEELRNLYLESQCLFLPLEAYTANNAVLEAASTNCPIIISTNAPSEAYLSTDMIKLIPLDVERAIGILRTSASVKGDTRRYVVEHFSWKVIAQRTRQFMDELIERPINN